MKNYLIVCVVVICSAHLFASCGAPRSPSVVDDSVKQRSNGQLLELEGDPVPFEMDVVEELNDGHYLHLQVRLTARIEWDLSRLIIRLAGLDSGKVIRISHYPVDQVILNKEDAEGSSIFIASGETKDLSLRLPGGGITDYQLELLWGEDAAPFIEEAAKTSSLKVILKNLRIKKKFNCSQEPCNIYFTFLADLHNGSAESVTAATLGIEFILERKGDLPDSSQGKTDNEVLLKIEGLDLVPGASKPLKIDLDKPVPEIVDAHFRPVIRVVEYQ